MLSGLRLGSDALRSAAEQRRLQSVVRLQISLSQLCSVYPVEQKKDANQKKRTGYCHISAPMESTPAPDQIEQRQSDEQDRPNPFPSPCYD